MVRFYWQWFKGTFSGKLAWAQIGSALATVPATIVAVMLRSQGDKLVEAIPFVAAVVFATVFVVTSAIGFLRTPYRMHKGQAEENAKLLQRVRSLEDTLPSIHAVVHADILEGVYVDVRNDGGQGEFQVQIEVLESTQPYLASSERRYSGYWDGFCGEAISIPPGLTRRIKLATFEQNSSINSGHMHLYYYDAARADMNYRETDSYFILNPQGCVVPKETLRVTVSSTPKPRNGPAIITMTIDAQGNVT